MTVYPVTQRRRPSDATFLLQWIASVVGGLALFLVFSLALLLGSGLSYASKIYPGISVAGIDLSGLTEKDAAVLLAARITYPQTGKIVFQYQEHIWAARPQELGLSLDVEANAQAAYRVGRSGNPFKRLAQRLGAWHSGENLPLALTFDERLARDYLAQIAAQINRPTLDASLSVNGLEVIAVPGQIGVQIDIAATLAPLEQQMRSLSDGVIPLVVQETPPAILDASQQAEAARRILSAPLTLTLPETAAGDPGPWEVPREQLAAMLTIQRVEDSNGATYQVALDEEALYTYLNSLAGSINRQPENARFIFNDDTRQLELIKPAVVGRNLDVYTAIKTINAQIAAGQRTVSLPLIYTQPEVGNEATGEQLGIREQIISYTTYFRGSSAERLQNIEMAAANFHGLLVPPGAVFSMASVMGNVSLDTGYAEAWIIYGGRTIKGVGGGVCQVSTTLFRAAFFAGFPIVERYPHAYRVGYYEQTANGWDDRLAGLDATVFVPVVDFKFTNDTPYWLLMETYFRPNSRSLTWKFYSTSDGRRVEWETTGPQNIVEPPDPVYEENPELAEGEIVQVDWAAEGADVTVTRTVYRDGQVLFTDTFITHYLPWADVYQYGPGTQLPNRRKPRVNP
ncbi:MAG: VanW family protein [Anaerolineales bacterium]|nr:VanW family protein [Anaerolineales bacterium]